MFILKSFAGTEKPQYLEPPSDSKSNFLKKGSLPLTWNEELLEAVKNKRLEEVQNLLASNSTEWDRSGPYVPVAAQWGHSEIVEVLYEHKANMDAMMWGKPAIMLAAENGHLRCCEILVKNDVWKDALDLDGETALSRAEINGHEEVRAFLRDVQAKDFSLRGMLKKRDVASVHAWVAAATYEEGGSIEERDRRTALVDEVSRYSGEEVMLLLAAQAGDLAEVKRLVEEEAVDPETKSADGKTCLELAARESHIKVVQYLSLFADHGQVKAILASLKPAAPAGQAKSKAGKSRRKKTDRSNTSNSLSSSNTGSNDGRNG